jgi:hypothetical protein
MEEKGMNRKRKSDPHTDKLFKILDKVLKQIYGKTAGTAISTGICQYLEERYSLKREDILSEPKLFEEALEECLGDSTAALVFGMILNKGSELKPRKVLWIYDPLVQRTKVALPC